MSDLFIIEAPGKREKLQALLGASGSPARVVATKGHLFQFPQSLSEHALDKDFKEINRLPRDQARVDYLLEAVKLADRIFIATDADAEGDVIAWDVACLIHDTHPHPFRVRLRGLDVASLQTAIDGATEVRKEDAVPGRTRALVDRLIGQTFSKNGVAVGRVSSALLGVIAGHKPTPLKLSLVAPDAKGGRPWKATSDIRPPLTASIADALANLDLPALSFEKTVARNRAAANMGDIMVRAGDDLDMSPRDADRALQKLYEAGSMSYPRASSRGVSPFVSQYLKEMAEHQSIVTSQEAIKAKGVDDVHDAPHPIVRVDVHRDARKLGVIEGVNTLVAQNTISLVADTRIEGAGADALIPFLIDSGYSDEVSRFVAALNWTREVGPRYPGQKSWTSSEVIRRRPDTALLEKVVELGIGRPSTWSKHIDTFMSRDLVDDDLQLTSKGLQWLRECPRFFVSPSSAIKIEQACEMTSPPYNGSLEPWEVLAASIIYSMPDEVKGPLIETVKAGVTLVTTSAPLKQISASGIAGLRGTN